VRSGGAASRRRGGFLAAIAGGARCLPGGTFATMAAFALWAGTAAILALQREWEAAVLVALALAGVLAFFTWLITQGYRAELMRDRRSRGLCVGCGYDLRASGGRCPECGRVAAAAEPRMG